MSTTDRTAETWIDPEEYAYPAGGFTRNGRAEVRRNSFNPDVVLPYGKVRAIRCSIPDTYFSIPARLRYQRRTVRGFITCDDGRYYFTPEAK
jgi:hypothetical protein